ncbi:MAG: GNAT family N-acetyltransferase [Deltaproteobacteria bacterium]|jgi:RimJ/RimL family protein N-acetyltransferase|nr:GNAT family N-acetyltransferase [Deltaproteobacteria bacterium]MCL5880218.1 GNAT family N-acetyltransferase [Deltaproteobacteria bacterium]
MNYNIRDIKLTDFEDIAKNYYLRYEELELNTNLGVSVKREPPSLAEELDFFLGLYKKIMGDDACGKVAIVDEKVVGITTIQRFAKGYETDHIGILGIDINMEYRNFGIGQNLLSQIIKEAKTKFEMLILEVATFNEIAMHIYKKLGFLQYGLRPKALKRGNVYFDYILMCKELLK